MNTMNTTSFTKALEFVRNVELPPRPKLSLHFEVRTEAPTPGFDFDKAKSQGMVVGSDIVAFVSGVTEEQRQDIVNATLLAQLSATYYVPDKTNLSEWYKSYFDTLSNIGWVIQEKQLIDYEETTQNLEAHEAILSLATSLLGPGTAALQAVKALIGALQSMKSDSPWITLFNSESRSESTAQFQVTLADKAADGLLVTLMAFSLTAHETLTQILFFKFESDAVKLQHASGKVTIDDDVVAAVREEIKQKLADSADRYVRGLPDLHAQPEASRLG